MNLISGGDTNTSFIEADAHKSSSCDINATITTNNINNIVDILLNLFIR